MKSLNLKKAFIILKLVEESNSRLSLNEQVERYVEQSADIIVDIGGVMLTSMLIGEILNLHEVYSKQWKDSSKRLKLANVSDFNLKVLNQVKLDRVVDIHKSLEDAVE